MAHGLDLEQMPVMQWGWQPRPPQPLTTALPSTMVERTTEMRQAPQDESLVASYKFNFAQLASQTPDLLLYRIVRLFNTPLRAVQGREALKAEFGYWSGNEPPGWEREKHAYFWTFVDQHDQDEIMLSYEYDERFRIYSSKKSADALASYYDKVIEMVTAPLVIEPLDLGTGPRKRGSVTQVAAK